jgi:hypothetical protein
MIQPTVFVLQFGTGTVELAQYRLLLLAGPLYALLALAGVSLFVVQRDARLSSLFLGLVAFAVYLLSRFHRGWYERGPVDILAATSEEDGL